MNSNPLVSVIVTTYNRNYFLKKSIDSILNQTFKDFELIVVDNFSNYDFFKFLQSFNDERIIPLQNQNNGIIAINRNVGIEKAKGEYIAFCDDDDLWYPDKLEKCLNVINNADVFYHDLDIHTQKGKRLFKKHRGRHMIKPIFVDLMTKGCALANSSVIVKKSIIKRVGGLSEEKNLITKEDFDLWLRISRITDKFSYIPKSLGILWRGGENTSESSTIQIERTKELLNRYFDFLNDKDREQSKMILSYTIGGHLVKMKLYSQAIASYMLSIHSKDLSIKLKSIISIIMIWFSLFYHKNQNQNKDKHLIY